MLATVLAAVGVFAALTVYFLESGEVVVLHTYDEAGRSHASRLWIGDDADGMWIEAASSDKAFYGRLAARPRCRLERGGETLDVVAVPVPGEAGHRRIRGLLRAKYGAADAWIGMVADTSESVAVRLDPVAAPGRR